MVGPRRPPLLLAGCGDEADKPDLSRVEHVPLNERVVVELPEGDVRVYVEVPEARTPYTSETRGGALLGTIEVPATGRYLVRAALEDPDPGSFIGFEPAG